MKKALLFTSFIVFMAFMPSRSEGQDVPALTGPVTDLAHVIDSTSAATLDKRIRALQTTTGDAIVVLTVPSLEPFGSIEEFAVKAFEKAGVGARGKDNGALVVLAVKERKVRIEVGYGLEEFITDGFAGETIRQAMLPEFRQGQYGAGLLAGTTRLIQRVAERRGVTLSDVPQVRSAPQGGGFSISPGTVVIGVIILILIINSINRRGPPSLRRRRWPGQPWSGWNSGLGGFGGRGWGGGFGGGFGGGGGGGFGGFGGGRSGGGGASGGW